MADCKSSSVRVAQSTLNPEEKSNQSQSDMNFSLIFSFFLVGVLAFELEDIADVERG